MGKLQDRENKRKSIIGGMIDTPIAQTTSTGSRGRPKADRELKKRIVCRCYRVCTMTFRKLLMCSVGV